MTDTTPFLKQILEESELLGIELELPEYFDRLDPKSQNAEADRMCRVLEKAKHDQFITNVVEYEEKDTCHKLYAGHGGNRRIIVLRPLQTEKYSSEQLEEMGMIGLYDHAKSHW